MKAILPSCVRVSFNRNLRNTANSSFQKVSSFVFVILSLLIFGSVKAQVPITYYDFEKNASRTTGELTVEQEVNTGSSVVSKVGSVSSAISYNSGAGIYNGGAASGQCISATDWTTSTTNPSTGANKYYQFSTSSAGFSGLKVAFEAQYNAGLAPKVSVLYSTNGTTFTASTTTPISISASWAPLMYFDLGSAADNAANLTIRIYVYGVSASSTRVDVDNIVLMASNQVSGSKTLLNYASLGLSLLSGSTFNYPWTNFTVTGSGTETILASDINFSGALTVNSGAALNCGSYTVGSGTAYALPSGSFTLNSGGTLRIGATSGITPAGTASGNIQTGARSFSAAANYEYNGSVNQSIGNGLPQNLTGTLTINHTSTSNKYVNLDVARTISNGGTLVLQAGTFANNYNLIMASGSTIWRSEGDMTGSVSGSPALLFTGSSKTATAEVTGTPSTLDLNLNSGATLTLNGAMTMSGNLTLTAGTVSLGTSSMSVGGDITRNGTSQTGLIKATSGTLVMNGNNNQSIPAGAFDGNINNLTINNASNVHSNADLTITNTLTLTAGKLMMKNTTLTLQGGVSYSNGKIDASTGTVVFNSTYGQAVNTAMFNGTNLKNLEIKNSVNVTITGDLTVTNSFALTTGTLYLQGNTLTLNGTFTRTTGVLEAASGTLVFNGTQAQEIPANSIIGYQAGSGSIYKMTIANTAGVKLGSSQKVTSVLTLQSGYLDINSQTLILGGTITGVGTLRGTSASALTIASGSAVGTVSFDQTTDGTTNALGTFLVTSGSATLGSKLHLYIGLNISAGTLDLAAKNLVLKSNATQTAYVAEIKGTLTGGSNVTVERYNPTWSSRRYRLVTSPVLNTTINAAWQEAGKWDGSANNPSSGYGTLITGQQQGTAAKANANGFDFWSAVANSSASIRGYVPGVKEGTWQPLTSTLTPNAFDNHQAYLLFIRGDRSVAAGTTPGAATVRATGTIKQGNFTVSVPSTQGYTLIGNPYASPLDFKAVYDANSTKIKPSFYIWQSALGTGTGGYVLVQPVAPGSSLYETIPGDGTQSTANRLIHSGEGFFVMAATTATSSNTITIKESYKSVTTPTVSVFRQIVTPPAKLYVNLFAGTDNSKVLLDGILSQYNNTPASDTVVTIGEGNLQKTINNNENLSVFQGGTDLILTSGYTPRRGDTLQLRMWNTAVKTYQLELRTLNFASLGLTPVLVDRYLNKATVLSADNAITAYAFSITSDAESKNAFRFFVVFREGNNTLPLVLSSLQAEEKDRAANITWKVANEAGIKAYQLEKSVDAKTFNTLTLVNAKGSAGEETYQCKDAQLSASNYYRVKMIGTGGEVKYSAIVKVQLQQAGEAIGAYPNPVIGTSFSLQLQNKPQGTYTALLYNVTGQVLVSKTIQHTGGSATETVAVDEKLPNGSYYLSVKNTNGEAQIVPVAVQR